MDRRYHVGGVSREAPVPGVDVLVRDHVPGGAANEPWDGPVQPERVRRADAAWQRFGSRTGRARRARCGAPREACDLMLADAERIAVVRANGIGDYVTAEPALTAQRRAAPSAHIVLVRAPWHHEHRQCRPSPVDEVVAAPWSEGVRVSPPGGREDPQELAEFFAAMQRRRSTSRCHCNDSGPRQLADALGTATVSVYWCGNVINAGPVSRDRHRRHISWTTACPVCGTPCVGEPFPPRCSHDVSFVSDVTPDAVGASAAQVYSEEVRRGRWYGGERGTQRGSDCCYTSSR